MSSELAWERGTGKGSVYSWSVVWRPQAPQFVTPYVAAIVDLDEGYQMIANLIDCTPEDIASGMQVAVQFHPIGNGIWLPYFGPAS
jgi:uncharacterized OB-fold protein